MTQIVQEGDPVLRQKAEPVPQGLFGTEKLRNVLNVMLDALNAQEDGVAIAAPQIGVPLRIFIVSRRAFMLNETGEPITLSTQEKEALRDLVFINPEIVKLSKRAKWLPEGCLSVRWKYGKVKRSCKATVRACDEYGKPFTRGASGLLAQIFQHETDHLEGVLFIDKAIDIEDHPPAETER